MRDIYIFLYLYTHDMALTASLGLALPVWARNPGWAALPGAGNGFTALRRGPFPGHSRLWDQSLLEGFGCLGLAWEGKLGGINGFLGAGMGPRGPAGCRFRAQLCRE